VTVDELSKANGISSTSYLHPDDELTIPTKGHIPTPTVPATEIIHRVQEGERLSDIAKRYGVSKERIQLANDMEPDLRIQPGDTLIVPLNPQPSPTPTRTPTATSTPGPLYSDPQLLYPLDDATFRGADKVVMLQWASVGILNENEWYALCLRYLGKRADGQPSEITIRTRITSWRVPAEWYPGEDASESRFEWAVHVIREVDKETPPTVISSIGDVRRFTWR